jgi:hypothetical protein
MGVEKFALECLKPLVVQHKLELEGTAGATQPRRWSMARAWSSSSSKALAGPSPLWRSCQGRATSVHVGLSGRSGASIPGIWRSRRGSSTARQEPSQGGDREEAGNVSDQSPWFPPSVTLTHAPLNNYSRLVCLICPALQVEEPDDIPRHHLISLVGGHAREVLGDNGMRVWVL